jgi:putative ATP-binding cassette transporter
VITHDDRYFPLADRVLKLDNGAIVNETRGVPHAVAGQASTRAPVPADAPRPRMDAS